METTASLCKIRGRHLNQHYLAEIRQVVTELRPYHTHQHIELPEIAMTVIHFILYRSKCGKTGK